MIPQEISLELLRVDGWEIRNNVVFYRILRNKKYLVSRRYSEFETLINQLVSLGIDLDKELLPSSIRMPNLSLFYPKRADKFEFLIQSVSMKLLDDGFRTTNTRILQGQAVLGKFLNFPDELPFVFYLLSSTKKYSNFVNESIPYTVFDRQLMEDVSEAITKIQERHVEKYISNVASRFLISKSKT